MAGGFPQMRCITAFAVLNLLQTIAFSALAAAKYWESIADWIYGVMAALLGVCGLVAWCVEGRAHYIYMVLNFLTLGLLIEPVALAITDCTTTC
eukprot:CAMPEP_0172003468 /NCGR_PEP_ID=MMETSP1041-20130122/3955_1 /TAXON_ID=464988 /ORGANISM="Hemiselmis andersenii, Strain CCMP439" /LENGTH=93 /DNA_ID=CAMNT_0012657249 /DNA_START=103 /DNA_END=381 /DNA_ORIENTATION=+